MDLGRKTLDNVTILHLVNEAPNVRTGILGFAQGKSSPGCMIK